MNVVELSIEYHCERIQKWFEKEKSKGNKDAIRGSIWYIIVGFKESSLNGPYYMIKDEVLLRGIFRSNYESLTKYVTDNSTVLGVCYFGCSTSNKSMFDFYQQERKWRFLSVATSYQKNSFSS